MCNFISVVSIGKKLLCKSLCLDYFLDTQLLSEKLMEMHINLGLKWVFATVRLRLHVSCIHKTWIILQGLLKVNDDHIFLLASEVDGIPIRFAQLKPFYVFAHVTLTQTFEITERC